MSRANLAHHVDGKMIAADDGVAGWYSGCERKGEQARDLLRDGVLSEKGRRTPSRTHLDFLAHGRRSAGYLSAPAGALHLSASQTRQAGADRCGHAQAGMGST